MKNKVALIDMDFCLCDYQSTMEPYLRSLESPCEAGRYDYSNMWKLEKDHPHIKARLHPIMSKQGFWTNMKPIDAGLAVYEYIAERFETFILSKAIKNCSLSWKEKVDWLHKYIGDNIEIMLVTNKKLVVGDLLFDDMPENAEDFLKLNPNGRVIMPLRPHNTGYFRKNVTLWDDRPGKFVMNAEGDWEWITCGKDLSPDFSVPFKVIDDVLSTPRKPKRCDICGRLHCPEH